MLEEKRKERDAQRFFQDRTELEWRESIAASRAPAHKEPPKLTSSSLARHEYAVVIVPC